MRYVTTQDGKIVLDKDGHPLRHFQHMPLTLTSVVEGWRLEAIKLSDHRIGYMDFRARMLIQPEAQEAW